MDIDPPIAAATLIVMRPGNIGVPQILVVERATAMAFAGGAIVFPGGRVDQADAELAARLGRPGDAAKITAIRETVEESAVLAGVRGGGVIDPALGSAVQRELLAGGDFFALLECHGLTIDFDALSHFARWMPAFKQARRFDTHFFLADAPVGEWVPRPQPGECQSSEWASAAELLERFEEGRGYAIFPTKRNLERVARFGSIEEARADAALHSIDTIVPWIEERDGEPHVCIPEDRGYPVTSEALNSAIRA